VGARGAASVRYSMAYCSFYAQAPRGLIFQTVIVPTRRALDTFSKRCAF
jgi:hypothetical protein